MTHGFLLPLVFGLRGYRRPGQWRNQARHQKHERASAISNPSPALGKAVAGQEVGAGCAMDLQGGQD